MAAYGSDSDFLAWLAGQGLTLPEGANTTVLRNIGSAYVDAAYGARLSCSSRTGGWAQELEWPRTGQYVNGQELPSDLIPTAWIYASYRAAYLTAITPGWATTGTDTTRQTRREKVDVIEREFFAANETAGSDVAPGMPSDSIINGMVLPWLCSGVRRADSLFFVI